MAITILHHNEKYAGTHAERLAMDTSRVSTGSTYFEWDTSNLLTWSGSAWVEKNGNVQGTVQLSGSIPEYAWFTGAEQPTPADQTKFAWGYELDETTGEISAYGWAGAAWVKVVI
jgi:hypothetical protein